MFRPTVPSTLALLAILGGAGCSELPTPPTEPQPSFVIVPGVPPTFSAIDLGTLPGYTQSVANDIKTNSGKAVGASYLTTPLADGRPVGWTLSAGPPVIQDLGLPAGAIAAEARAVNASNTVAGASYDGTTTAGFTYTQAGGFTPLTGPPGSISAQANDLNDAGVVVGAFHDGLSYRAFRYSSAGGYVNLHPAGYFDSHANAINEAGVVVGTVTTLVFELHAAVWDANGVFTDLGGFGSLVRGYAWDINSRDNLVGTVASDEAFAFPFPGAMTILSGLREARGISSQNRIVGKSKTFFNAGTTLGLSGVTDTLPLLLGSTQGYAQKVSRCGHTVGYSIVTGGLNRATVWQISACD